MHSLQLCVHDTGNTVNTQNKTINGTLQVKVTDMATVYENRNEKKNKKNWCQSFDSFACEWYQKKQRKLNVF